MAGLELRNGRFNIIVRYGGKRFVRSLKTTDEQEAIARKMRVEENIRLVESGRLAIPENADFLTFLLSDGKISHKPVVETSLTCTDTETVKEIIQFNNTQNAVKVTDYRSNDPVQRRLRQEFSNFKDTTYLGGRRGGADDKIRRNQSVLPTDSCSQALASFHQEPGLAYHRKSELWESDKLYSRFFSDETTASHVLLTISLLKAVAVDLKCYRQMPSVKDEARSIMGNETRPILRECKCSCDVV